MNTPLNLRARGLVGVRADATDATKILNELKSTFEQFKAERDAELEGIKNKFDDVVQKEKVDRINNEIEQLSASLDDVNASLAALKVGGAGEAGDPAKAEHRDAFMQWFRKGGESRENALHDLEVKASLRTDSDPDGGYTVPEEMSNMIDRVQANVSAMRGVSQVMTIGTDVFKKLVTTTGASYGWVGEREARTETNAPQLSELAFNTMELYANPAATQKLLDDSFVNVSNWLANEVAVSFGEAEGAAFITGTGVNQPRGILSYDTVADASWTWGNIGFSVSGVAADINDGSNNGVDAMIDVAYSLKQGYRMGASWLMNRTLQGKVRKLKTIGTDAQYLWQPPVQLGQPATLLGYPVIDDDNMPNVGANAFPIAFGNFNRGYLIVDRFGIRVLRDPYTNKPYVHFYTTKRVGGGVQNYEAIKLLKCST